MNNSGTPAATNKVVSLDWYRNYKTSTPSTWNWKERVIGELNEVIKEEDTAINDLVQQNTRLFIDYLANSIEFLSPSIAAEPNGEILFEWYKKLEKDKIGVLSVIIGEDRIVYSTYNIGEVDSFGQQGYRGVAALTEMSVNIILEILNKHFINDNVTKRFGSSF